MRKILFVCTGNTCRSPIAEAFFNNLAQNDEILKDEFYAESAGIAAYNGIQASEGARNVMKNEWDISLAGHHSRNIDADIAEDAFLILPMTYNQKENITACFPGSAGITHVLQEYVNAFPKKPALSSARLLKYNITDPFGLPLQVYSQSAREIRNAVIKLIEKLKIYVKIEI